MTVRDLVLSSVRKAFPTSLPTFGDSVSSLRSWCVIGLDGLNQAISQVSLEDDPQEVDLLFQFQGHLERELKALETHDEKSLSRWLNRGKLSNVEYGDFEAILEASEIPVFEDLDSPADMGSFGAEMDGEWWEEQFSADSRLFTHHDPDQEEIAERLIALHEQGLSGREAYIEAMKPKVSWDPNWIHLEGLSTEHRLLAEKLEREIAEARTPQACLRVQKRLGLLMAVSIAVGKGATTLPNGNPFPDGIERCGLPFSMAAKLQNSACLKAGWLIVPDTDWNRRAVALTYRADDSADKERASSLAKKLSSWFDENVLRGLKVRAIAIYPEKTTSDEGDVFEHAARQGAFLAEESEDSHITCPLCNGTGLDGSGNPCYPCDGAGSGDYTSIMTRVRDMTIAEARIASGRPFEVDVTSFHLESSDIDEWLSRTSNRSLSDCPSVEVSSREEKKEVVSLAKGVIKVVRRAKEKAPRLTGWNSPEHLISSLVRI